MIYSQSILNYVSSNIDLIEYLVSIFILVRRDNKDGCRNNNKCTCVFIIITLYRNK